MKNPCDVISPPDEAPARAPSSSAFMLEFELPDLEDRLIQLGIAESSSAAKALWLELKRYLALSALDEPADLPMVSALVDAAWHQFLLYDVEYASFCLRGCGRRIDHQPATPAERGQATAAVAGAAFVQAYERHFGPLPDLWRDERNLQPQLRLIRRTASSRFSVEMEASRALLVRLQNGREVVCRASSRARPALEFIAEHRTFLVRELPGLRSHAERQALLSPLVQHGILRIAA